MSDIAYPEDKMMHNITNSSIPNFVELVQLLDNTTTFLEEHWMGLSLLDIDMCSEADSATLALVPPSSLADIRHRVSAVKSKFTSRLRQSERSREDVDKDTGDDDERGPCLDLNLEGDNASTSATPATATTTTTTTTTSITTTLPNLDYAPSIPTADVEIIKNDDELRAAPSTSLLTHLSNAHPTKWRELVDGIDSLVRHLSPTQEEITLRQRTIELIKSILKRACGAFMTVIGSTTTRTFLPTSDINLTVFVGTDCDSSWFIRTIEALCAATLKVESSYPVIHSNTNTSNANHNLNTKLNTRANLATAKDMNMRMGASVGDSMHTNLAIEDKKSVIEQVSFVGTADVKVITAVVNGFKMEISMNCLISVYTDSLLEKVDSFVGRDHLFKRSLLLLKAWFAFEVEVIQSTPTAASSDQSTTSNSLKSNGTCPVFDTAASTTSTTTSSSAFPTAAVEVMLIWVFNWAGQWITLPAQALEHFLAYFNNFDWTNWAISVLGPVLLAEATTGTDACSGVGTGDSSSGGGKGDEGGAGYLPAELLLQYQRKWALLREGSQDSSPGSGFLGSGSGSGPSSGGGEGARVPLESRLVVSFPHSVSTPTPSPISFPVYSHSHTHTNAHPHAHSPSDRPAYRSFDRPTTTPTTRPPPPPPPPPSSISTYVCGTSAVMTVVDPVRRGHSLTMHVDAQRMQQLKAAITRTYAVLQEACSSQHHGPCYEGANADDVDDVDECLAGRGGGGGGRFEAYKAVKAASVLVSVGALKALLPQISIFAESRRDRVRDGGGGHSVFGDAAISASGGASIGASGGGYAVSSLHAGLLLPAEDESVPLSLHSLSLQERQQHLYLYQSQYQWQSGSSLHQHQWSCFDVIENSLDASIGHAELVLFAAMDGDAIIAIVRHILELHGPLSVGDIGTFLLEVAGNMQLLRVLKAKFLGLRKLIEQYSHVMYIGNDQPKNPRVYLVPTPL